ncbi:AI-2E family transporter [Chitinophaga sp. GCM10012297]|uniref:AI-2E family transporter n=1 Tax=Chitinophaga chungangae TaxID=2821488 RepID=A0ABS3YGQ4_9BACT|nr:AI-2E family transporter [Chitinophaga chungangae]MBO9153829.1 AI-2E family transporter [Chitinophaga chungangae]
MRLNLPNSRSIIETILVLLLLLALLFALYDVLKVFFGVFTFALIFSVSFATPYERLANAMGQRRKLASTLYAIVLIIIVALPVVYIVSAMGRHIKDVIQAYADIQTKGLPPLPETLTGLPFVGSGMEDFWKHLQENPQEALMGYETQIRLVLHRIVTGSAGVLGTALQFVLGIVISAILLAGGDKVMRPVKTTLQHLLGRRDGLLLLDAATHAIKGVSIGVMGTAFVAAFISWIGFVFAGLHFKILLCALVFFLVLIQVGPLLVWLPLVIILAVDGHTGTAIFAAIYGLFVMLIDAVLKPVLIAKSGGKLPFLVLFIGVVGGLAAWGFTGMFKGAIILALFYTLFNSWLERRSMTMKPAAEPGAGEFI